MSFEKTPPLHTSEKILAAREIVTRCAGIASPSELARMQEIIQEMEILAQRIPVSNEQTPSLPNIHTLLGKQETKNPFPDIQTPEFNPPMTTKGEVVIQQDLEPLAITPVESNSETQIPENTAGSMSNPIETPALNTVVTITPKNPTETNPASANISPFDFNPGKIITDEQTKSTETKPKDTIIERIQPVFYSPEKLSNSIIAKLQQIITEQNLDEEVHGISAVSFGDTHGNGTATIILAFENTNPESLIDKEITAEITMVAQNGGLQQPVNINYRLPEKTILKKVGDLFASKKIAELSAKNLEQFQIVYTKNIQEFITTEFNPEAYHIFIDRTGIRRINKINS